jgi:mRNA interferase MazF
VPIDNLENKSSVVAASLIQTLSWQERKAKFIVEALPGVMEDVLLRFLPLIGADKIISV